MTTKPTIEELRHDEVLLRRTIAKALQEGPWEHAIIPGAAMFNQAAIVASNRCEKCNKIWHPNHSELAQEQYEWVPGHSANHVVCRTKDCPVPDADNRPMEVLVHELVGKCKEQKRIGELYGATRIFEVNREKAKWYWFAIVATLIEQAIACLLVLGEAVVAKEDDK